MTPKLQRELEEILANSEQVSEEGRAEKRQPPERLEQTLIDKTLHAAQKTMCFTFCLDLAIDWVEYRKSMEYARNAPKLRRKIAWEHFDKGARRTIVNLVTTGAAAITVVSAQAGYDLGAVFFAAVTAIPLPFARKLYKESQVTKYWG